MISEIQIHSRFEIVAFMNGINQYKLTDKPFILISCFGNEHSFILNNGGLHTPNVLLKNEQKINLLKQKGMVDFVNVHCDDITLDQYNEIHTQCPGEYLLKLYDQNNAKDVVEFIEKYKNDDVVLIIHCDAGVSRSSAHGIFAQLVLKIPTNRLFEKHPWIKPNYYIVDQLCKYYGIEYHTITEIPLNTTYGS